jgi:hypothetical protein
MSQRHIVATNNTVTAIRKAYDLPVKANSRGGLGGAGAANIGKPFDPSFDYDAVTGDTEVTFSDCIYWRGGITVFIGDLTLDIPSATASPLFVSHQQDDEVQGTSTEHTIISGATAASVTFTTDLGNPNLKSKYLKFKLEKSGGQWSVTKDYRSGTSGLYG